MSKIIAVEQDISQQRDVSGPGWEPAAAEAIREEMQQTSDLICEQFPEVPAQTYVVVSDEYDPNNIYK